MQKLAKHKNNCKVRDRYHYTGKYRGTASGIYNLKYNMHNEISIIFHNGSNCDYHFTIKKIVNDFEGQSERFRGNAEKYKKFSVQREKEVTKIDKDGNESILTVLYKIKFIDGFRLMMSF